MSDIVNEAVDAVLQGGAPGGCFYVTTQGEDGIFVFDAADQMAAFQLTAARGMGFLSIQQVGATLYLTARGASGCTSSSIHSSGPRRLPLPPALASSIWCRSEVRST